MFYMQENKLSVLIRGWQVPQHLAFVLCILYCRMLNVNPFYFNPDWDYSGFYEAVLVLWLKLLVVCLLRTSAIFNLREVGGGQGGIERGLFFLRASVVS